MYRCFSMAVMVIFFLCCLFLGCTKSGSDRSAKRPAGRPSRAVITMYFSPSWQTDGTQLLDPPKVFNVTDADVLKQLYLVFADAGQGRDTGGAGPWMSFVNIEFSWDDGSTVEVFMSSDLLVWAEQDSSDRFLPDNFEKLFREIVSEE